MVFSAIPYALGTPKTIPLPVSTEYQFKLATPFEDFVYQAFAEAALLNVAAASGLRARNLLMESVLGVVEATATVLVKAAINGIGACP